MEHNKRTLLPLAAAAMAALVLPASAKELPDPEPVITDFHESVRTRKKFALNEENAFWSCTMVNMGKIAHRLNKNLKFDPKTLTFDDDEATALVNQPMRGPWKIEY